ncbi:MAG: hypothetical protein WCR21_09345 [Bacteroidota bacterium]
MFVYNQIRVVSSFQDLVTTQMQCDKNALFWQRNLPGDFSEIVHKLKMQSNITLLDDNDLNDLILSEHGQLARAVIIEDMALLKAHGAAPVLNIISKYDRDIDNPVFPTDVYSFHVDRSPIVADTFLCTYHGDASEILPNSQAEQKIHVPEIRAQLKKQFNGPDHEFENYLEEAFYDLHYQAKNYAQPVNLGLYNMWRLAVDCEGSSVLPCIHRAPEEKSGQSRLLMIC